MKHSQKAKIILSVCMLMIGLFSAWQLFKAFRPSAGLPYEQLTLEQAQSYMEYEEGYLIADVRSEEAYAAGHLKGAISTPYQTLIENALTTFPDKTQMIYIYGENTEQSGNACRKLSEQGYNNITQIVDMENMLLGTAAETEGISD